MMKLIQGGTMMRCAAAVLVVVAATAAGAETPTVANLQAAFESAVRAEDQHRAFASRAEHEGRRDDAALFRAAAHAERVHARMHSDVIRRLGGDPRLPPIDQDRRVRDTRGNLRSLLAQVSMERATLYPRYVDVARREAIPEAVLNFTLARDAEAGLVDLCQHAIAGRMPASTMGGEFHVCETCGHIARGVPPDRCSVCSNRGAFTRVR